MGLGEERGKAGDGDVMLEQAEVWNAMPSSLFRLELGAGYQMNVQVEY